MAWTRTCGWVWVFAVVDHYSAEALAGHRRRRVPGRAGDQRLRDYYSAYRNDTPVGTEGRLLNAVVAPPPALAIADEASPLALRSTRESSEESSASMARTVGK
jgi:hypothetical protein